MLSLLASCILCFDSQRLKLACGAETLALFALCLVSFPGAIIRTLWLRSVMRVVGLTAVLVPVLR